MRAVLVLFALFGLVLTAQLVRYQLFGIQTALGAEADAEIIKTRPRGNIVDERGRPLALDRFLYEIVASPNRIEDAAAAARSLAPLLDKDVQELERLLTENKDKVYLQLAVVDSSEVGETIRAWGTYTVTAYPMPRRFYPEGALAAHALGFVNWERRGYNGVEGYFDSFLRAPDDELPLMSLERRQALERALPRSPFIPSAVGRDLVLTLNRSVQDMVEKALLQAIERYEAEGGSVVILKPNGSAVLAMASWPTYDPNDFANITDKSVFINPVISAQYEPGSVFKLVTYAAALEAGVITPESEILDTDEFVYGERTIQNWDKKGRGRVTATEALAQSLNVSTAKIAVELGADGFYRAVRRFGFGQLTEVELAGEIAGLVKIPGRSGWYPADLATNSFGQGISVTPLQMANAMATIASGGVRYRVHVVEQMVNGDRVIATKPKPLSRAISVETAQALTQMMVTTVERLETARIEGYAIAGKTGTAEIPLPSEGYEDEFTIVSFAGFFPADDPQFVILVKLDRPKTSRWATQTAAPLFRDIAQELIRLYTIPPDDIRLN
ncbi:MAG: penicillin-binding protein 2 [Chloroflexi bacterium]|nr:penicillin-binding protein 2 [Chloroflexota bacterium]